MKEDDAAEEEETFIANNVEELAATLSEVWSSVRSIIIDNRWLDPKIILQDEKAPDFYNGAKRKPKPGYIKTRKVWDESGWGF